MATFAMSSTQTGKTFSWPAQIEANCSYFSDAPGQFKKKSRLASDNPGCKR